MEDDPVDHRGDDDLVAEDSAPASERQVAPEDQRGMIVRAGDELEPQVRGVLSEGDVADFVDDDQPEPAQFDKFGREPAVLVRGLQSGDPLDSGREQKSVPGLGSFDAELSRKVRFAGAGRSQQDDILRGR